MFLSFVFVPLIMLITETVGCTAVAGISYIRSRRDDGSKTRLRRRTGHPHRRLPLRPICILGICDIYLLFKTSLDVEQPHLGLIGTPLTCHSACGHVVIHQYMTLTGIGRYRSCRKISGGCHANQPDMHPLANHPNRGKTSL